MLDAMRFWLDRGVDGFRVDVIGLMMKDPEFRDEPQPELGRHLSVLQTAAHLHRQSARVHDLIGAMRKLIDSYDDRMMVGETYLPNDELMKYYGTTDMLECHLPFNFQLILAKWIALAFERWWTIMRQSCRGCLAQLGARQPRPAPARHPGRTLTGAPPTCFCSPCADHIYYGDELGMEDVHPPEKIQDPPAVNQPEIAHIVGRDPERTPMQWDDSPNAGFSAPEVEDLWLPIAANYKEVNVASELKDPRSFLNFYRELWRPAKPRPPCCGEITLLTICNRAKRSKELLCLRKKDGDQRILVALNFSGQDQALTSPAGKGESYSPPEWIAKTKWTSTHSPCGQMKAASSPCDR